MLTRHNRSGDAGRSRRRDLGISSLLLIALLGGEARAEAPGGSPERAWLFLEAWRSFRFDLDTTLPGEHGEVLLIERLPEEPTWLIRQSLRLSQNPEALSFLARRAGQVGDRGSVSALRRAAGSTPNPSARRALERALVRLGDEATIRDLAKQLRQGSPSERWQAAASLQEGDRGQTERALLEALEHPDIQTQLAAASTLALRGNGRAKARLYELLESPNPYQRLEAAHALALAGDRRAIAPLREKLQRGLADRRRLVRSLGFVGGGPERDLLIGVRSSLPRGRSLELRRELLLALGRIALRSELDSLSARFSKAEREEAQAVHEAWLEAIGYAVAKGARGPDELRAGVRESAESSFAQETPVAQRLRRHRVERLLAVMSGEETEAPQRLLRGPSDSLSQWLRAKNSDDPAIRSRRFDAALSLMVDLGSSLGFVELADPPEGLDAVGLNGERAVDGNLMTSWVAGAASPALRLDLDRPRAVKALHLIGGCVDSRESFQEHARVKRVRLSSPDGLPTVTAELADGAPLFQRVPLPGGVLSRLTLEVLEVYPGERDGAPACVPELRLE